MQLVKLSDATIWPNEIEQKTKDTWAYIFVFLCPSLFFNATL